jgi:hypothetical protein
MHARNAPRPGEYIRRNFCAGTMGFNLPMLTAAATVFGSGRLMSGRTTDPCQSAQQNTSAWSASST